MVQLFNKFMQYYFEKGFIVRAEALKVYFKNTRAEGTDYEVRRLFAVSGRVNMLEVFSVTTVYARMPWAAKVRLLMYIFDFDGNKALSRDELAFLFRALANGLSRVNGEEPPSESAVLETATQTFDVIDKNPDNRLTVEE